MVEIKREATGAQLAARGADKNPWPADKALQSLRGTGAARAVRALVDFAPPYGIRELAAQSMASPATLSRVLDLLEGEGLVERNDRGGVTGLDWAGTIRRWAQDYDVLGFNSAVGYLQPRGPNDLTGRLRDGATTYALTGSVAANLLAPFAPARLAMIYVDNLREAVEVLDLRETDSGANVMVLEPFDEVVTARRVQRDGLWLVNPSQLAADLLTSPGRGPPRRRAEHRGAPRGARLRTGTGPRQVEDPRRHPGRPPRSRSRRRPRPTRRSAPRPRQARRSACKGDRRRPCRQRHPDDHRPAVDPADTRSFDVKVAGPATLLVAKIHKIAERVDQPDRLVAKDALDVLRLLQATPTGPLAASMSRLRAEVADIVDEALAAGDTLFGTSGQGLDLVGAAVAGLADEDVTRASLQALWADLSPGSSS